MERMTIKGFNFTRDFIQRRIDSWGLARCLEKLQKYEDMEEEGLLLKNPVELKESVLARLQGCMDEYRGNVDNAVYEHEASYYSGSAEGIETAMQIVEEMFCGAMEALKQEGLGNEEVNTEVE